MSEGRKTAYLILFGIVVLYLIALLVAKLTGYDSNLIEGLLTCIAMTILTIVLFVIKQYDAAVLSLLGTSWLYLKLYFEEMGYTHEQIMDKVGIWAILVIVVSIAVSIWRHAPTKPKDDDP